MNSLQGKLGLALALLASSACVWVSPSRQDWFRQELAFEMCDCAMACWGGTSMSACSSVVVDDIQDAPERCTFDGFAARDCLEAWRERECPPCPDPFTWDAPEGCEDVYTDCEEPDQEDTG